MYTFVPKAQKEDHQPRGGKPSMQIIDHRRSQSRIHSRSLPTDSSALEIVMEQRNALFDNELGYKRRIKDMEREAEELADTLEQAIAENRSLKNNISRGPTRADFNKLSNEKKSQQNVIEKLAEENFELNELLQRVMKRGEADWQEAFENVRRRQEERFGVIGPFVSRVQGLKKRTVTMNDGPEKHKDQYDAHLDYLLKNTQSLSNRLKQLKREKRVIDYSLVTGERKCFKNLKEFKEIGGNVNRDLIKYSGQLENLSDRHAGLIKTLQTSKGLIDKGVQTEEEEKLEPEIVEVKEKKKKKPQKRDPIKLPQIPLPNKGDYNDSKPTELNGITLPLITNENAIERQRTIVKTNENTDAANGGTTDDKKIKENQNKKSLKSSSPLTNKSSYSQRSLTSPEKINKVSSGKTRKGNGGEKEKPKRTKYGAGATDIAKLVTAGSPGRAPHR